ncbi:MAG: hypothetical protein ABSB99_05625 [Acidimicrobiales bacterium]|jgi:hypothetical protein
MFKLLRKLIQLVLLACVLYVLAAVTRALMARLQGEPGASNGTRTASCDSWPPVPRAPDRSSDPA